MNAILITIYFLFLISVARATVLDSIRNYFYKTIGSSSIHDKKRISPMRNVRTNFCDENQLMLNLANLEIISPERILLMLTTYESSSKVCGTVTTTIRTIENDQKGCKPLADDNLFNMLFKGLKTFEKVFCQNEKFHRSFDMSVECLRELREEFIDCEGPADWFEFPNKTIVCRTFSGITACDYVKTTELCGIETGKLLYNIITPVMVASLKYKCKIPKKMPEIIGFAADVSGTPTRQHSWAVLIIALTFRAIQ